MPLKRRGALQVVQREVDEVNRQTDRLLKDAQNPVKTVEDLLRQCQKLQVLAEETQNKLKKLTKADELAPVGNYEQRKQQQENRIQNILERLNSLSMQLSPPGPSSSQCDVSSEDSEDDDDDDDEETSSEDDDDDEDDEDDDSGTEDRVLKPPSGSDRRTYVARSDFTGEEDGDLSVRQGQTLQILRKRADGWWLARDAKGNRGVVPKNFLMGVSKDDDRSEAEDELDEDERESDEMGDHERKRASRANWSTIRKALTEIDATDVLSAMGAIPSGFRPSMLAKLLVEEGERYRGSHYIQPELSQSQLSFKDLFLDPNTGRVRSREVKTSVCFSLWSCKMIPTPGVGVLVLSRHIRMCAFDGTQVLSNIHTVRATYNSKSPKTWNFSPRMTGFLPNVMDGDCFLRCNSTSPNLGILFELGITFIRNSTGERGDLSCGWSFLNLSDDAGNPLPNRTFELPVHGGTPCEEGAALENTISKESPGGIFHQIIQARRQPKIIVKLKLVKSRTRAQLRLLPDTLLHSLRCVHLLALHRQLLADTLLMDRPTMQNADLICSPILSTFPAVLEQTDLLDALKCAWLDAEMKMSRVQKRDLTFLKQEFSKVYMSSVYFLLHSPLLPPYRWADPPTEDERGRVMFTTLEALKEHRQVSGQSGGLEMFSSPVYSHLAFDASELTFDLLNMK